MQTLFYLFVLYFLTFELFQLFPTKAMVTYDNASSEETDKYSTSEKGAYLLYLLWMICSTVVYWIVTVIGIVKTEQRILFGVIFLISVLSMIFKKILSSKMYKTWGKVDCTICVLLLATIIIKQYFLH